MEQSHSERVWTPLLLFQVCEVLFAKATKYDDLYSALTSLLAAGSQFDTLRRKENKNVTALVRAPLAPEPDFDVAVLLLPSPDKLEFVSLDESGRELSCRSVF